MFYTDDDKHIFNVRTKEELKLNEINPVPMTTTPIEQKVEMPANNYLDEHVSTNPVPMIVPSDVGNDAQAPDEVDELKENERKQEFVPNTNIGIDSCQAIITV